MDKRVPFFAIAAAVSLALAPIADAEHRWVAIALSITYVVLAVLTLLDSRNRSSDR